MVVANVNKSIQLLQFSNESIEKKNRVRVEMLKQNQKKMTFQLYKIHITVIVKRHQWKILNSVPNTQQANKTRIDKPLADNFKSLNMALHF